MFGLKRISLARELSEEEEKEVLEVLSDLDNFKTFEKAKDAIEWLNKKEEE